LKVTFLDGTPTADTKTPATKEKIQKAVSREELITDHKSILDVMGSAWKNFR
jgi:hypothetical protein